LVIVLSQTKKFLVPFILGALGYAGLILLLAWIQIDGKENHLALVYSVLPVLPGMVMLAAVLAAYREMDELQRRIHSEAVVVGFLISVMVFFAYGLFEAFSGFPHLNMGMAAAIMTSAWGLGVLVSWRRYR
jgi:hypothetical protein